jgi:hypothetical protein
MPVNKLQQNRKNYYVTFNVRSQIVDTSPGQLNTNSPTIDSDLYLLLNGENGTGNSIITGTPANQVPYPSFSGSRAIYSSVDLSPYNHQMINVFRRGFHAGSAFKNILNTNDSRTGNRYWFAPNFPSNPNVVYFPKFKVTLDSFVAGCSVKITKPPKTRVSSSLYRLSLLGTSWEPSSVGWYTYLTIEPQVDPTPAFLIEADSGNIIDKDVKNKLNLVLYFVYNNNIITSHVLYDFKYNTWVDLAWSYNNNVVLLSINNNTKTYYTMPTLIPLIANSYDLVLGPVIPNCYRFMGAIDNLYIKKYS